MRTTILAWLSIVLGIASIGIGGWGAWILIGHTWPSERTLSLRYKAFPFAMVAGGVGLIGLGQALRLLLFIFAHP